MKRLVILAACLALAGCFEETPEDRAIDARRAQQNLDSLIPACRDGVQYLVTAYGGNGLSATPHLKPDGKPYTCEVSK